MSLMKERYVTVARAGEVLEGAVKVVRIEDQPIGIARIGGRYYAFDDVCTHDGGPLAEGILEGEEIECPRHGARFNVTTGAALTLPATAAVSTYPVRVEGDEIQVAWPSGGAGDAGESARGAPAANPASEAVTPGATKPAGAGPAPAPAAAADDGSRPAPSQQEMAVRAALESVMDPEINLSVIDLGLIREVHFLPDRTLVRMMLTTPFCPYAPELIEQVKQATMGVVSLPAEVEIMPDPWSPELMPDPGLLGYSY